MFYRDDNIFKPIDCCANCGQFCLFEIYFCGCGMFFKLTVMNITNYCIVERPWADRSRNKTQYSKGLCYDCQTEYQDGISSENVSIKHGYNNYTNK